jgi:hypothetical protein
MRYDEVDNPTEIHDWRLASEWPDGAKPVTRKVQYDDLYRVSQVDYQYEAGSEQWKSPFDAENNLPASNTSRARPSPQVKFDKRIQQQTFSYDWLGNTEKTGDDADGFWDRSLGGITNDRTGGKATTLLADLRRSDVGRAPRFRSAVERHWRLSSCCQDEDVVAIEAVVQPDVLPRHASNVCPSGSEARLVVGDAGKLVSSRQGANGREHGAEHRRAGLDAERAQATTERRAQRRDSSTQGDSPVAMQRSSCSALSSM